MEEGEENDVSSLRQQFGSVTVKVKSIADGKFYIGHTDIYHYDFKILYWLERRGGGALLLRLSVL